MNHGLTLTSLIVAVALSGILAVVGVRMTGNQMNTLRVMELRDKGDSIFRFYSNLLHDDKAWWCTLYDGTPSTATPNKAMRDCVLGQVTTCASSGTLRLMGPDCQIKFTPQGARDFSAGNFTVGTIFIPAAGKSLKESALEEDSGGWWNVKVTWESKSNTKAVDLILTQTFTESRWQSAPSTGKRYTPELDYPRTLKVRRSANYVPSDSDTTKAITAIARHTAARSITRHTSPLVDTTVTGLGNCHERDPKGQVVMSTTACSGDRVAVTPTNKCASVYSVIDRIGDDSTLSAWDNVGCARDGDGKMVRYGTCPRRYHTDSCAVSGGPTFSTSKGNVPGAITRIDRYGRMECEGVPSWPSVVRRSITAPRSWYYPRHTPTTRYDVYGQGDIGPKGPRGRGPRGRRGPAYNSSRCRDRNAS